MTGFITPAMDHSVSPLVMALLAKQCTEESGSANTNNFTYVVSVTWMNSWRKYTGLIMPFSPGATNVPGPVEQDWSIDYNNEQVDGKLWRHLISWYGLHPEHELTRYPKDTLDDNKSFDIGMMSTMSGLLKSKLRWLNIHETVGYIECQLQQILGVPRHRETRIWAKVVTPSQSNRDNGCDTDTGYQLLTDRYMSLEKAFNAIDLEIIKGINYLRLEVCNFHGEWPTGYLTEVKGNLLAMYGEVTIGGRLSQSQHDETLCEQKDHEYCETQAYLQTQINTYQKHVASYKLDHERLFQEMKRLEEMKEKVDAHEDDLYTQEKDLKLKRERLEQQETQLQQERDEFEKCRKLAEELNAMTDDMVTLNVGGKYFTTSLQTLCKVDDNFFSSMFSGRYPLKKCPDGSYFIDRDGTYFHYILEYLRNEGLDLQPLVDAEEWKILHCLYCEADYYSLNGLYYDLHSILRLNCHDLSNAFRDLLSLADFDDL